LPPPRGNTAARPSLFYCPWGLTCFVFVDLCDSCNIDMHNRLWDSVLFESFGAILEGLEPSWPAPGVSWAPLGACWDPRGGLLEPPGALLGASCRLLGGSWGQNDPNLAPQDDPKSSKNRLQKMIKILIDFKTAIGPTTPKFWALKNTQNQPKSHPKRVKNEDDFQERQSCSSRASWGRLGPILRHFGGHLGSQICAPVHAGVCLVKHHVLDADKLPRRVLDRSWPILAAKSAENDPNLAPQDDPKSNKNRFKK
jgi:hypothetical protein